MVNKSSNTEAKTKVLWLLGMHRSGTSMTANWLHHCGLNLGDSYIPADVGNKHGYYEDKEIVRFHKEIIRENNLKDDVHIHDELKFDESQEEKAKILFSKKCQSEDLIVWKDPRTCLTIDLWNEIIGETYAIVLFRHFDEVVDSLVRRKAKAEKKRRNFIQGYFNYLTRSKYSKKYFTNSLLESWVFHNQKIIEYLETKKAEEVVVFNPNQLKNQSKEIFHDIDTKFNLGLSYFSFEKIFDKKSYKTDRPNYDYAPDTLKRAEMIFKKLNSLRTIKN